MATLDASVSGCPTWYDTHVQMSDAIHDRRRLGAGTAIAGPAILEEPESTVVVPPGITARVNPQGHIVIETGVGQLKDANINRAIRD